MADADDSYDFENLEPFVERLRAGADLSWATASAAASSRAPCPRCTSTSEPGAVVHRELFFKPGIRDFHCGLRGFNRARIRELDLQTTGMEFASEMVGAGISRPLPHRRGPHDPQEGRSLTPAAPAQLA